MFQALDTALAESGSDYDKLPEPIKCSLTEKEYLWLSDAEKARLVQSECEPEW